MTRHTRTAVTCALFCLLMGSTLLRAQDAQPIPTPLPPEGSVDQGEAAEPSAEPTPGPAEEGEKPRMIEGVTQISEPEPSPTPPSTSELPVGTPVGQPSPLQEAAPPADTVRRRETRTGFPDLNIYLPEGEFDIRTRRLIKNVLFEGQVNYNFIDGDISTFLRYKYYARNLTYIIGVFDTLEFESVDNFSGDFDRVRGGLIQFEYPVNYNNRWFSLFQSDSLLLGDVDDPDNNKHNLYFKGGYQFGTTFDERLNSIVGESRGRVPPVLSAYRELGPQKLGFALGVTQSFESGGDYSYTKLEGEALKRFDIGRATFLVSRLHFGTMVKDDSGLVYDPTVGGSRDAAPIDQPTEVFLVPRYEYLKIGGRAAMKGVDDNLRGTDEVHLSNEYFFPIFRNRRMRMGILRWTNLYGIVYAGVGTIGFTGDAAKPFEAYKFGDLIADAGLGVEASLTVRDIDVYFSAVYAQVVHAPGAIEGDEIRFSVRTSR